MYLSSLRRRTLDAFLNADPLTPHTARSFTDADRLRAELLRSRERGYASDNEEFMTGMAAVAVPILGPQNRLMATISVHAPIQRHPLSGLLRFLPVLQQAAAALQTLHRG
jgi:DNA-binding IclR family transcriptional regulator